TYARLPESFYASVAPTPVAAPRLLRLNRSLAEHLRLDPEALASAEGLAVLAGNRVPDGGAPIAMAYAGHQFGHFVPSLGDGRAVLIGEVVDRDGVRHDIHLKGAGRTPYSRMGDGRAALGPVLREYVVSEAMAGLGIPTTRALAMIATGESVLREGPQPGAILVRTAASHVRVGTFEYFYRRGDIESVRTLADYVIARHYPHCADAGEPYRALLDEVVARQADLVARWLLVGFIHGVMNTDNTSVAGETIDYGPCAFMDTYHPQTVYSSIDIGGRYAYDQQPNVALWNLVQLAQCLLPLLADEEAAAVRSATDAVNGYAPEFQRRYGAGLRAKLGLAEEREGDRELALELLRVMAEQRADFTNTFRRLCDAAAGEAQSERPVRELFDDAEPFDAWAARWRERLDAEQRSPQQRCESMRAVNPAYIPRNHRVQQAIDAASRDEPDLEPLDRLLAVVSRPFDDHPGLDDHTRPPQPHEVVQQTFCGT
ncbi:MAG: YdiU family protein, partial [Gammaproteobacteria bacterium]|nr:YdiU family protein [Gammaproteobacteria bacterium]